MTKATSAPQLAPGTVIDGMYTLGEALRSRVAAVTYEATDPNDKKVEVTVYRPDSFMNPMAIERALRELRQVSTVDDPRVVHVFDSGKLKDGGVYEVHERVEGKTLGELEALEPATAAQILKDIVAALEAASRAGVVHRNLGPDVVIRGADGVKVGGFAVGEPQGGVSFGAIECIAPEQVEGKNIDEPTLVYNLAALAHRLLTGKPLFVGDVATQLLQHAASTPPSDVHPALLSALGKDAKARPSLAAFAGDLGKLSEGPRAKPAAAAPAAGFGGFGKVGIPTPGRIGAPPAAGPRLGPPPGASLTPPPAVGGRTLFGAPTGGSGPKPAAAPLAPPAGAPSLKPPSLSPPGLPTLGTPPPPSAASSKPGSKPRTRGWTMFMEATDDESAPATGAAAAPPPVASAPAVSAPAVPAATAPAVAAPSIAAPPVAAPPVGAPSAAAPILGAPTLGAPAVSAPPVSAPSLGAPVAPPAVGAPPVAAPSLAAPPIGAPAAAPVESKPSVRGWTLIMDDPEEAAAATPVVPAPAAAPSAPSTRGWTMLEELNSSPEAESVGVPMSAAAAEAAAAAGAAPTSRGWTMFMEAELEGEKAAEAAQGAVTEPEPEFYDGPMTTDAGTVVAFAPEAPSARPPTPAPAPSRPSEEPMSSFASKLRGEEEPIASFASKLRGDEAAPEPEPEESLEDLAKQATSAARAAAPEVPAAAPEMPSFGGNAGFELKPTAPPPGPIPGPTRAEREPAPIDDEEEERPSSPATKIIILVMAAAVVAFVYYFFVA